MALDHVSLQAPAVDVVVGMLRDRLGLITTPTPAAPHRHGRVYLDRSYLEVATGADAALALFFLRYDRLDRVVEALAARGVLARTSLYEGHDGVWEDVEIEPSAVAPVPHLTRRITPAEVAEDWPPPLAVAHPCGAEAVAAVHLRVPRLGPAVEMYERLLGSPAINVRAGRAVHRVGPGRIVLHEAAESSSAIVGAELRVASLQDAQRCLSALGTGTWRAEDTLWADLPGGWRLGFCEAERFQQAGGC